MKDTFDTSVQDTQDVSDWYKNTTVTSAPPHTHNNTFGNVSIAKTKYFILGEEYECNITYNDAQVAMIIATLNILGEPFWIELKKQGCILNSDMTNFIETRLKIINRNNKVEDILK